jgi:hypothetical protein
MLSRYAVVVRVDMAKRNTGYGDMMEGCLGGDMGHAGVEEERLDANACPIAWAVALFESHRDVILYSKSQMRLVVSSLCEGSIVHSLT